MKRAKTIMETEIDIAQMMQRYGELVAERDKMARLNDEYFARLKADVAAHIDRVKKRLNEIEVELFALARKAKETNPLLFTEGTTKEMN